MSFTIVATGLWDFPFGAVCPFELDHFGPFGMWKNRELLLPNCIEDHVSDLGRRYACLDGGLECGQTGLHFRVIVTGLLHSPGTLGVGDVYAHKSWAEHRYFDERVPLLQC
jgi:hypothetical protein